MLSVIETPSGLSPSTALATRKRIAFTVAAGMGTLPRSFRNTEALGFF